MKGEERLMGALARFVAKRYKLVLLISLVVFILSVFAAANIEMKTEIKDMMPEDNPQVQGYIELDELFAGGSSIIITIEGDDKERMIQCAEDYVAEVRSNNELMEQLKTITFTLDEEFIREWGLILQKASDLEQTGETFSELNLVPFITSLNDSFEKTYTGDEAEEDISTRKQENEAVAMLNQLEVFFTLLHDYLQNPEALPLDEQGRILAEAFMFGERYGFNYDNTMLMFTLIPDFGAYDIEIVMSVMDIIRQIEEEVQSRYPDLVIGYTGDIPIGSDEQVAMSYDLMVPAIVALVLILMLFIFSFRQLRSIIFIIITLIIGIVMNYGFIGITTGEINMLTSIMAVLLIGLGVDYGIQIVTNFSAYRRDGYDPAEAMTLTFKKAGMGILLAALTTAVAFFVMAITGTHAFAEFGMILGTGILMCFLAMIFILPAFLMWFGKKDITKTHVLKINYGFLVGLGKFTSRHKWVTVILAVIVTAGLLTVAILKNEFDYDLLGLEPQDMPSIVQYEKIMEKYEITPFQSMLISDSMEESRRIVEALGKEPLVGEVGSITAFLPDEQEQRASLAEIEKIRNMPDRYTAMTYTTEDMETFAYEVQRVEWNIIEMGDLSVAGLGEDNKILLKRTDMIREIFGAEVGKPGKEVFQQLISLIESNPALYSQRLSALDGYFAAEMDAIVSDMAAVTRPITINDIPESITKGYIDESGTRNLIMIYPTTGIWKNIQSMERFNDAMTEIEPRITGYTQITTAWMEEANVSTIKAGIYIFIAVLIFLIISFRNIRYTVLAIAPLVIGMIWMLGIYPLLGFKLNILNIIVIPLVIGMGIDFGIHLAHRFKVEQDIHTVYTYTGKAVFLSAFTTMIGFGSLGLIGKFPSLASMGVVLFFGIASCLAAALIVLPALLSIGKKKLETD